MAELNSTPLKKQKTSNESSEKISYLRSLKSIRATCTKLYDLAVEDKLENFRLNLNEMPNLVDFVLTNINTNYPKGAGSVPFHSRWRHFEPGNPNRVEEMLYSKWGKVDALEKCRRCIDLAIVSVLLDAGAGSKWKFEEGEQKKVYNRSEGLGIASLHMFTSGVFSANPNNPFEVNAEKLIDLPDNSVAEAFQVDSRSNPLVGCEGRTALLQRLGTCLKMKSDYFYSVESKSYRPGNMVDYLVKKKTASNEISIHDLWTVIIDGLEEMWPKDGRTTIGGVSMGDVWPHSKLAELADEKFISFHKLSQWLTYSLMEPLEEAGMKILGLEYMTGLPEYRNGGLLIDLNVLIPKKDSIIKESHDPSSEVIIEWRGLTVALLDVIHKDILKKLNTNATDFPLVKMLQGGTWAAGRVIAKEKRPDGKPPIQIISDGTVF